MFVVLLIIWTVCVCVLAKLCQVFWLTLIIKGKIANVKFLWKLAVVVQIEHIPTKIYTIYTNMIQKHEVTFFLTLISEMQTMKLNFYKCENKFSIVICRKDAMTKNIHKLY